MGRSCPRARETLIGLFDRELVESQETVGVAVLGQFRDLDDPDAFVWLRGFADMDARRRGLEAFYGGPVWACRSPWRPARSLAAQGHAVAAKMFTGVPVAMWA